LCCERRSRERYRQIIDWGRRRERGKEKDQIYFIFVATLVSVLKIDGIIRLCLDIKGKKVGGKIVKGMKVKRKWMESEMIVLVVCYEWKWWESEMKERYVNKKMTKLLSNKNKIWLEKIIKIILWLSIYVISSKKQSFISVRFKGDCILRGCEHKTFFPYLIVGKPNYRKKNILQPSSPSSFFLYSFSKTKHSLNV